MRVRTDPIRHVCQRIEREQAQPTSHQIGNPRLSHADQLSSLCLRQLPTLHHSDDFMRRLGTELSSRRETL